MRVFVTGATGIVGKRAVARLVAAGHQVTGIARGPEKAAQLANLGARPVTVSLFEPEALAAAIAGHDAVINLATKIPPLTKMATPSAWAENERIRTEGSRNVVDAAIAAGATVFVQESLAFLYGDYGDSIIDAASAQWADTPFTASTGAAEANVARFAAQGGRGIALRFGRFYAAGSSHTETIVAAARRGMLLDIGNPTGYSPVIDADDAAAAVVAALDAPSGTYDIVVDEPFTRGEQQRVLARAVGRRRLWGGMSVGVPKTGKHLAASQRVSNQRFRDVTPWRPLSPSVREGWPKVVGDLGTPPSLPGIARLVLWILGISGLQLGLYAQFFPRAFYDDFPIGRNWVAIDGPYNEHLVRDFGAMNLAMAVVAFAAIATASIVVARVAMAAWLVFSLPHFVYHLRHLQHYDTADKVANIMSLGSVVVAAIFGLWVTRPRPAPIPRRAVGR